MPAVKGGSQIPRVRVIKNEIHKCGGRSLQSEFSLTTGNPPTLGEHRLGAVSEVYINTARPGSCEWTMNKRLTATSI